MMKTFVLTSHLEAIVKVVNDYHYLRAEQVCRLLYSRGSLQYVKDKLKLLVEQEYLYRQRPSSHAEYIYFLGKGGSRILKAQGIEVHYYPSEHNKLSSYFLEHETSVSDFLIAAKKVEEVFPPTTLLDYRHDLTLKRQLKGLIPDGWMVFRTPKENKAFWLELDRGTIEQKRIREKVNGLLDFFEQGKLEEVFTMPPGEQFRLRFVFATTAGVKRRDNLITWIDAVLSERYELKKDQDTYASLFCISYIPEGKLDPQVLFYEPHWYTPRRTKTYPLLVR